jgi:hypothetical protein
MYRTTIITTTTGREIIRSLPQTELKCSFQIIYPLNHP